jgi:4-oxalocrotonate tautomerase
LTAGAHKAAVGTLAVPPYDRFQVITEHKADGLIYDPPYLGVKRTDTVFFVRALSFRRLSQQKRQWYKRMVEIIRENPGLLPADLLINLAEVSWVDGSFGNGAAQYMPA